MTGDPSQRSRTKTNLDMMVLTCVSAGLVAAAGVVSQFFGIGDTGHAVHEGSHVQSYIWGAGAFAITSVPLVFVLSVLRNIRRRRHESWIAEAEDLLWVAGMIWNSLAVLAMVMTYMHETTNGLILFTIGLVAPLVLALPTAIHTGVRTVRSGGKVFEALTMAWFFWLAAALPSFAIYFGGTAFTAEQGWFYSHAISYVLMLGGVCFFNRAPDPALDADAVSSLSDSERIASGALKRINLPQDDATPRRCWIATAMCLTLFLHPMLKIKGDAFMHVELGLLAPWIYWAFLNSQLRKEQVQLQGTDYSDRVRPEWIWVMAICIGIFGAWLNYDLPTHPAEWAIPLLGMMAMCCGLCSYLLPNHLFAKTAGASALVAAGMMIPGVSLGLLSASCKEMHWTLNPMFSPVLGALGAFLPFVGLYQLRELTRFVSTSSQRTALAAPPLDQDGEVFEEGVQNVRISIPQGETGQL